LWCQSIPGDCYQLNQVFQGSTKPVKSPDDQGIPFPEVREGFIYAWAGGGNTAHMVNEDFFAAGLL
jgi:hypothetical protein